MSTGVSDEEARGERVTTDAGVTAKEAGTTRDHCPEARAQG